MNASRTNSGKTLGKTLCWVKGDALRNPLRHKVLGRIAQLVEQLTLNRLLFLLNQNDPVKMRPKPAIEIVKLFGRR